MAIPEGYTELGRIGFVDKGNYAAGTTYRSGDVVYYNGSTWTALKDNLKGVAPTNGANWKYMARGFAAENLASVTAKDTSGVIGTAGASVTSQALVDAIADKVMTKLLAKANVVNNLLTTEAGFALDARQGKALKDGLDSVNSDLAETKNNLTGLNNTVASHTGTIATKSDALYQVGTIDCNNCSNGLHLVDGGANLPTQYGWYLVLSMTGGETSKQVAWDLMTNATYQRHKASGAWSTWTQ